MLLVGTPSVGTPSRVMMQVGANSVAVAGVDLASLTPRCQRNRIAMRGAAQSRRALSQRPTPPKALGAPRPEPDREPLRVNTRRSATSAMRRPRAGGSADEARPAPRKPGMRSRAGLQGSDWWRAAGRRQVTLVLAWRGDGGSKGGARACRSWAFSAAAPTCPVGRRCPGGAETIGDLGIKEAMKPRQTCVLRKRDRKIKSLRGATGGGGGIRTHGALRLSGFQDRRIRPLCHPSDPITTPRHPFCHTDPERPRPPRYEHRPAPARRLASAFACPVTALAAMVPAVARPRAPGHLPPAQPCAITRERISNLTLTDEDDRFGGRNRYVQQTEPANRLVPPDRS